MHYNLQRLNQAQFQALSPAQLGLFYGNGINRFTQQQLSWLTTTQIAGLQQDQIAWLSASTLDNFTTKQLQSITNLGSIMTSTLSKLSYSTIAQFTAVQVATLTRSHMSIFTPSQIQAINPGSWSLFNATQLSGLSAFQLSVLSDAQLASVSDSAIKGLPELSAGLALKDWIATPGTGSSSSALATTLLAYNQDAPGASVDFANTIFTDPALAAGSILQGDTNVAANGVTFSGRAGITSDRSVLNSYQETITVPVGDTNYKKYVSSKDLLSGDIYWGASDLGSGDGGDGTTTKTVTVANNSTDGNGDAAYVIGDGAVNLNINGLLAGEDYQIAFNSAQAHTNANNEQVEVLIDGKEVGVFTPSGKYSVVETDGFTVTAAGPHTVTLKGIDAAGSSADGALISSVHIALASEAVVLSGGVVLNDGTFVDASANQLAQTSSSSPSPWAFSGNAGVAGPLSAAFVGTGGMVSQTVSGFEANRTYSIAFDAAQARDSAQGIQVLVDGKIVDTVTATDGNFRLEYSATFNPGEGSHVISFRGIGGVGTVNFSNVRVLATGFASDGAVVTNGSFDPATDGWNLGGAATIVGNTLGQPVAVSGNNAAQIGAGGTLEQEIANFAVGESYAITFRAAQTAGSNQTLKILVDGTIVGTYTPGQGYSSYSTSVFQPGAGTHRISIEGAEGSGSALVSDVELALLPAGGLAFTGNDNESLLARVPNQDEIQRTQWASLAVSAAADDSSVAGGDAMLSVSPDTAGLAAMSEAPTSSFKLGWQGAATMSTDLQISSDQQKVTKEVAESDGSSYETIWAAEDTNPSGASIVSQSTAGEISKSSGNGSLPLAPGLSDVTVATTTPGTSTGNNTGVGQQAHCEPGDRTGDLPKDTVLPVTAKSDTPDPKAGFWGNVSTTDSTMKEIIKEYYNASPKFAKLWDNLVASLGTNESITIDFAQLCQGTVVVNGQTVVVPVDGSIASTLSLYGSDLINSDKIYIDITSKNFKGLTDAQKIALIEDDLAHELVHSTERNVVDAFANNTNNTGTNTDDHEQFVNAFNGIQINDVLTEKQMTDLGIQNKNEPIQEVLAHLYAAVLVNGNGFVSPPNGVGANGQAQNFTEAQLVGVAADILHEDAATLLTSLNDGTLTAKDLIQQVTQQENADFADDPNLESTAAGHPGASSSASGDVIIIPPPPKWIGAQNRADAAQAFVGLINDIEKGGLANDLAALAAALQVAGLLPNFHVNIHDTQALLADSQFVSTVSSLVTAFQQHSTSSGFAAASAVASEVGSLFTGSAASANVIDNRLVSGSYAGAANVLGAVSAVLGDVSQMFSGSSGPGSLQKDLQYVSAAAGTAEAVLRLFPNNGAAIKALGKLAAGVGDVLGIIDGFEQGGVLGGIEAGYSAGALAEVLGALNPIALPIGIAIGLAALFFGGHHDDPGTMPDQYDEPTYGQQTANLRGTMGAGNPVINYTEDSHLVNLFAGRTGIQVIEETLAMYGTVANAPAWLKPMFNELEAKFGESATGSGTLLIGDGGSGKHCNNQEIVGVAGVDGQVYQYAQLDSALSEFQAAYASARAAGQAMPLSWSSASSPGSLPPSDTYAATSYQSEYQYYA